MPDKDGQAIAPTTPANPTSWTIDPLLERQKAHDASQPGAKAPTVLSPTQHNFDGIDFQGVNPSDPVLDVGTQYVIAATNGNNDTVLGSVFVVHDKETGALVAGPTLMASLTIGSVAPSCLVGFSDPIRGGVTVLLPADSNLVLSASSPSTIELDFPSDATTGVLREGERLEATLGAGGAELRVRSGFGPLRILPLPGRSPPGLYRTSDVSGLPGRRAAP